MTAQLQLDVWTDQLADQLAELLPAGVPVSDDPRDLALPGVWVTATAIRPHLAGGSFDVDWTVIVLGGLASPRDAARQLGQLAGPIGAAFGAEQYDAATVAEPNLSPEAIPALRFTITTECETE